MLSGLDFAVSFGEDGMYYSNFLQFKKSLRMRLLALRYMKPHLFEGMYVRMLIILFDKMILL